MKNPANNKVSHYLQRFLTDKLSLIVNSCSFGLLVGIYFLFYKTNETKFFPDQKNIQVDFYNDSIDHGKSEITRSIISDSSVSMSFILKDGFIRPYAGIGFEKKDHSVFNVQPYNRIGIDASSHNIKPFFVYLIYNDSTKDSNKNSMPSRHLCHYIEISSERKQFVLNTNDFYTPDWWFDKYNLSPASTGKPKLNQIYRLAIVTGLTPRQNQEQSIQINSIIFYSDNTIVVSIMAIIQLVIVSITFLFYYIKTKPKKRLITISYNALPNKQIEKTQINFLDYIHENYHESDLNLNIISKKTGVHIRKIAESISSQFNCNVKTYINQIRINEAKRLLKESTFNRSEIAYRVGFSSPSNFNRVFKNLTGISPSEYLQNTDS